MNMAITKLIRCALPVALLLLTACSGGGGGSTSAATTASGATTAVGSYISDSKASGFVGSWSSLPASTSTTTGVLEYSLVASTANTYAGTLVEKLLTNGIWASTNTIAFYDLIPSGWLSRPNTWTLLDSGDGTNITVTYPGEPAIAAAVTKTDLTGTAIRCGGVCVSPTTYPSGSSKYSLSYVSDRYELYGTGPITDASGGVLLALPALGVEFCDAYSSMVYVPTSAAATGFNYNVFSTVDCAGSSISTALTGTALFTAVISSQATGNVTVPNVLLISGITGAYAGLNNSIYGLRAGNVWAGYMSPSGAVGDAFFNKIYINAQLQSNQQIVLP